MNNKKLEKVSKIKKKYNDTIHKLSVLDDIKSAVKHPSIYANLYLSINKNDLVDIPYDIANQLIVQLDKYYKNEVNKLIKEFDEL